MTTLQLECRLTEWPSGLLLAGRRGAPRPRAGAAASLASRIHGGRTYTVRTAQVCITGPAASSLVGRLETPQQVRHMLLFRRLPGRRPEALGRTLGRRTLADDGTGAGLEGRHTGKYRRAYEFMVSPRHACRCPSVGSLSPSQKSVSVVPTLDMRAARAHTLGSYDGHGMLLMLATPCAVGRRKNIHTKCAKCCHCGAWRAAVGSL